MKKDIEFTTIREDLNIYEVENGQILKAKSVVTAISEGEDKKGKFGDLGFQTISHVVTPKKIDTTDYEYLPTDQITDEHESIDLCEQCLLYGLMFAGIQKLRGYLEATR